MSRIRERLTYANVMSTIAVFGVLGGGAYAASTLDRNEVKSKHIKAGAVKNADLADDAVTTPKVANGSLLGEDFAAGQLPAGPQGPQGEAGQQGQDATKLFAYIADGTGVPEARLQYGSGVVSVFDPDAPVGEYTVTFNRSLQNCVVQAVAGTGSPAPGSTTTNAGIAGVDMDEGTSGEVDVRWVRSDNDVDHGVAVDTSFMITAFC